jgi:hypothetical protein
VSDPRRAVVLLLLGLAACAAPAPTAPAPVPEAPPACPRIERIEVRKSARRLVAECTGGGRLELPVTLGREPVGPKQSLGDRRTPEGDYHIAGPARPSRFHRFLPLDYPALADAERALAEGRLPRADYEAVRRAHASGRLPPQDTALGGHVGFHGEGARWAGWSDLDWTDGCIALSDEHLDLLAARAPPGTPVRIVP